MITISLCMIVKDEENVIERCLDSVAGVMDEIIIVDTGSTDRTVELCRKYTNKIFDYKWEHDFAAARNYSYCFASMDYIMWMDADDILMPKDKVRLQHLKQTLNKEVDVIMMRYITGIDIKGEVNFSYYRERLSKRQKKFLWKEPVHECLDIRGHIINCDIAVTHAKPLGKQSDSDRNIKIYEDRIAKEIPLSERGKYYYARELKDHGRYEDAAKQFEVFLDANQGWMEDNINACSELGNCYVLLNESENALRAYFRSFTYDIPRAEVCCQIAYLYQRREDYKRAAFWFEFILSLQKPVETWGFIKHDCWDYIPLLECAVCYDRLGEWKKAQIYNNRALEVKPKSAAALANQLYFEKMCEQEKRRIEEEEKNVDAQFSRD